MKLFRMFLLCAFLSGLGPLAAQHNPYLDKKKKNLPSARMAKDNRKHLKRQKKEARKLMRRSKKDIARSNRRRMRGN